MKKITLPVFVVAVVLSAGSMVAPATPALAQSGSRLCGKTTTQMPGIPAFGYLTEVRQKDTAYKSLCAAAIRTARDAIKKNPQWKNLKWTKHHTETCESVGKLFQSSNSPEDMCDMMRANEDYEIYKTTGNRTIYDRLTETDMK